jgi:hypothetical protein
MGVLKNCDMWNWQYQLTVIQEKNDKDQPYYNYLVTDLNKATAPDKKLLCEKIWETMSKKTLKAADIENPDMDTPGAAAEPKTGGKF